MADRVVKTAIVQSVSSLAMSAASSPQTEVDVPNFGDLIGLNIELTQISTGTLVTPNTIDFAIESMSIKDRLGNPIWQNIRGRDLNEFELLNGFYVNNKGINTAVATSSTSSATRRYHIPFRIDGAMYPVKFQMTIAPFSAMAASGTTGGTVSVRVSAIYRNESANDVTDRLLRLTQAVVSGTNRFAPNLPKGRLINHLAFSIGTESNLTRVTFSSDGSAEISDFTISEAVALDQNLFNSGHVTGIINIYNSPFVSTDVTIYDIEASGSDTLQHLIVLSEPTRA